VLLWGDFEIGSQIAGAPDHPAILRSCSVFSRPLFALSACIVAVGVVGASRLTPEAQTPVELLVYSSRSHYGAEQVFTDFTRDTGIKLNFFEGNNNEVFERLRSEGARTRADVLLTVDAGNLWNAARNNLLAPVDSATLRANVPEHLRDPDGQWYGIAVRARTIMYHTGRVKPADLSTYEALADPKWKGRLCLRSSSAIYNQSLIASLIREYGPERTEKMVRGWVANTAATLNNNTAVLEAIAAGQCDVGLTNTYYLARLVAKTPDFPVRPFWADQQANGVHVNISGAGVTRHTRHRAEAVRLIEYLTRPDVQTRLAGASFEYPVNAAVKPVGILEGWGTFTPQRSGVAAAGQHQADAVRLADRAGYR
jgi:iron(III) transport system substrate-binding protein